MTFYILSNSSLLLKKNININEKNATPIITIIGIGSSSSFTKGAPIVAVLDINTIILIAVAFLENGNTLSS
jgi:hypothetical protein